MAVECTIQFAATSLGLDVPPGRAVAAFRITDVFFSIQPAGARSQPAGVLFQA